MVEASALLKQRVISIYLNDTIWSNTDDYDTMLALYILCESGMTDTVSKTKLKGFINKYIKSFSSDSLDESLDALHEESFVWINSTKTVSLTVYGKKTMMGMYEKIRDYDKTLVRPVLRALKAGKVSDKGEVISKENIRKTSPTAPYTGVLRHSAHRWFAYVNEDGKRTPVGTFKKAIEAAKARDRYIKSKNLKIKLSLK